MSVDSSPAAKAAAIGIKRTFHPTLRAPDLKEAERFFERIFGAEIFPSEIPDFSSCTIVRDVFFETVVPERYVVDGIQRLASIDAPHLYGFGWYVDDVRAAFEECRRRGILVVNSYEEPIEGDELPSVAGYSLFFTSKDFTGMRYTLFPEMHLPVDPRTEPGWELPPLSAHNPLGITISSHHTILTHRPERALNFVVGVLGGEVIHTGRNELLGTTSTYVYLADSVLEYAVPDRDTPAHADWARSIPSDCYHAINWQVADLDMAEQHLQSQGVKIRKRSDDGFVTDPTTSLGLPWGFYRSLVTGDPREGVEA